MFSTNKLILYVSLSIISIAQTAFAMEIPSKTHQAIICKLSQEDPNTLGRQIISPYTGNSYIENFPTNKEILQIAKNYGEEELIFGYMEQLGLCKRYTVTTERITHTPYIYYPTMTHTSYEVIGTTEQEELISGKDQAYAQWIYSTYGQWISALAQKRIANEAERDRQRNIEWQKEYEIRRKREIEEENKKRELEKQRVLTRNEFRNHRFQPETYYQREKSPYDYAWDDYNRAKSQHNLKCLGYKVLDELYFVQNNKWADVCKKDDRVYKTRRTPEQIKAQENFNREEPKDPCELRSLYDYSARIKPSWVCDNSNLINQSNKISIEKNTKIPKKVKFEYSTFHKTYEYVEVDLNKKLNFVIQEYNNNNSILTITGNSTLDLNGKQFNLNNLTKKDLLNELETLRKTLLARKAHDIAEAQDKISSYKEKVSQENALIKAKHDAFIEQLESERKKHEFECACQKTMQKIMKHNEAQLIKVFLHIRSFLTAFEFLSPLKDGKDIKRFSQIEQHAFTNPGCNSLKILREQAHLLATIKYAPCYVRVICEPDQLPIIEPIDTFLNAQELQKFTSWYQSIKDKPWDVDSTDYIEKFSKEYCSKSDSFFDGFKYFLTNTPLFTYKQIEDFICKSQDELVLKTQIQRDLSPIRNELSKRQDDMDNARVFTKEYEWYYPTSVRNHCNQKYESYYPAFRDKLKGHGVIEYEGSTDIYIDKYSAEPVFCLKDPNGQEFLDKETKALWNSFLEFVKNKVGDKIDKIISRIRENVIDLDHSVEQPVEISKDIIVNVSEKTDTVRTALKNNGNNINNVSKLLTAENQAVQWTPHGYKHVAPKNLSWKKIVKATTHGNAVYKPGTDIKELELYAWENGTKTTNGKNWKVFKCDSIIGANSGKETYCVRVECSANTIHGHPISESAYLELLK